jgi:hypothetical protein
MYAHQRFSAPFVVVCILHFVDHAHGVHHWQTGMIHQLGHQTAVLQLPMHCAWPGSGACHRRQLLDGRATLRGDSAILRAVLRAGPPQAPRAAHQAWPRNAALQWCAAGICTVQCQATCFHSCTNYMLVSLLLDMQRVYTAHLVPPVASANSCTLRCTDCCTHCWCHQCATCQELRELDRLQPVTMDTATGGGPVHAHAPPHAHMHAQPHPVVKKMFNK